MDRTPGIAGSDDNQMHRKIPFQMFGHSAGHGNYGVGGLPAAAASTRRNSSPDSAARRQNGQTDLQFLQVGKCVCLDVWKAVHNTELVCWAPCEPQHIDFAVVAMKGLKGALPKRGGSCRVSHLTGASL